MTTGAENLRRGQQAAFRAWGAVVAGYGEAFKLIYEATVEWAVDERSLAPANGKNVPVLVPGACTIVPEFFAATDATKTLVPAGVVTLTPNTFSAASAGTVATVLVQVHPRQGAAGGLYQGRIMVLGGGELKTNILVSAPVPGPV